MEHAAVRLITYSAFAVFLQRVGIACYADRCICHVVSVRLSVLRHIPVFCRDEWSYDHAVFTVGLDNHPSFWRSKGCLEIRRGSSLVSELKYDGRLLQAKIDR